MSVTIYDNREDPDPSIPLTEYSRCLENAAVILGFPQADIEITLVDDEAIQAMNRRYRQIDKPTNVLSFPLHTWSCPMEPRHPLPVSGPDDPPCVLGDIVLSTATIQREAAEYQTSFTEQFMRMTIHGMLHLVGFEHDTEQDEDKMLERTEIGLKACLDFLFRS